MEKRGPWTIKSSETKYKSNWMEVVEHQVVRPDGHDGTYGTVFVADVGAHVLPFDDEGNVYLIREFAFGTGRDEITIIAGAAEKHELPLDAAKRELLEETGISATDWKHLGYVTPLTTFMNLQDHMFIAKGLTFAEHAREGTEQIELIKMPFAEAVQKALSGEIRSEVTCLAILRTKLDLESHVG